jgi:chromosome segregation ATPase
LQCINFIIVIIQEKTTREMQEKSTWAGVEEKNMTLTSKLDQERNSRESECESLRKRIKNHEDTQVQQSMLASEQQNRIQELATSMEQLQYAMQQLQASILQVKREGDENTNQTKQLCHAQFNELKQMLHNEQLARERSNEQGNNTTQAQIKALFEAITKEQAAREQATKLATSPLWDNIDKLTRMIEQEKLSRTDTISKVQQAHQDLHALTRDDIKKQVLKLDQQILKSDKTHGDRHFSVNMSIERETEERNHTLTQLRADMELMETKRKTSEKEILKLIASTMSRLKSGMETELHPSLL